LDILDTKRLPELTDIQGYVLSRTAMPFPVRDRVQAVNLFSLPI
jgi:hypothetical protein